MRILFALLGLISLQGCKEKEDGGGQNIPHVGARGSGSPAFDQPNIVAGAGSKPITHRSFRQPNPGHSASDGGSRSSQDYDSSNRGYSSSRNYLSSNRGYTSTNDYISNRDYTSSNDFLSSHGGKRSGRRY
jgi:hypothetical protein